MADFNTVADRYRNAVEDSISFSGQDLWYFASRKAECLIALTRQLLDAPKRLSVLDVGCGIGTTDGFLTPFFASVHGVDIAEDAIAYAARANPGVDYQCNQPNLLPFADKHFDVAFAACVLHHVSPAERAGFVAEMRRIVRPGGLVVVFEHNPLNPLTRLAVSRCDFDEGVELLTRRESKRLFSPKTFVYVQSGYTIFSPWNVPFLVRGERFLRRVPMGAQYYVAARR